MRHGYTNDVRGDGAIVVKRFLGPNGDVSWKTEHAMLSRLDRQLPVPRLLTVADSALHMEYVSGVHGQELIEAGHAARVLRSCGDMLHRIQSLDVRTAFPGASLTPDTVLVHGDFGPNNMLFDPATFAVTAVLDWEWAHPGDAVERIWPGVNGSSGCINPRTSAHSTPCSPGTAADRCGPTGGTRCSQSVGGCSTCPASRAWPTTAFAGGGTTSRPR
jgi:hypothetical protein